MQNYLAPQANGIRVNTLCVAGRDVTKRRDAVEHVYSAVGAVKQIRLKSNLVVRSNTAGLLSFNSLKKTS
jgi:hypothetical protein